MMNSVTNGIALDIDDTLCETAATAIAQMCDRFHVANLESTERLLRDHKQPGLVPAWQFEEAQVWLADLLHSPDFLLSLPEVREAKKVVKFLAKKVPIRCYITSRTDDLRGVTEEWLQQHHFPSAPIIMRTSEIRDLDWKLQYFTAHNWTLTAFIDNEQSAFFSTATVQIQNPIWLNRHHEDARKELLQDSAVVPKSAYSWKDVLSILENNYVTFSRPRKFKK